MRPQIMVLSAAFALLSAGMVCRAQDGSIQDSWDKAGQEKRQQEREMKPPASHKVQVYPEWERSEGGKSAVVHEGQWKYQPPAGIKRDLYSINHAIIDSLSALFCIPSSYIKSLRNRNEVARGAAPPPVRNREFQYEKESAPHSHTSGEAMEQLHRELLRLLELCLTGG